MDAVPIRYDFRPAVLAIGAVLGVEAAAVALPWPPLATTGVIRALDISFICIVTAFFVKSAAIPGLFPQKIGAGLFRGAVWALGFGTLAGIGAIACYLSGIDPLKLVHVGLPADGYQMLQFFLVGGIIGPIAEELFFRGVIYGMLRRWGIWPALILTTLLFVLAHSAGGIAFPHLVGGIVFAAAYEYETNIIAPMVIHVTGNLALFSLGFF